MAAMSSCQLRTSFAPIASTKRLPNAGAYVCTVGTAATAPPVSASAISARYGRPPLENTQDTPGNGVGFENGTGRKCRAHTPSGL